MEIRKLIGDEKVHSFAQTTYAFQQSPADYKKKYQERKEFWEETLTLGSYENGTLASVASIVPLFQNIRGKIMKMGGVAGVATYPEFRKRGHVKGLMLESIKTMRDEGQSISCLYPFRESFYEKFGYSMLPQHCIVSFDPRAIKIEHPAQGSVQRFNVTENLDEFIKFKQKYVGQGHCHARFTDKKIHDATLNPYWIALAKDENNVPVGCVAYTITGFEGELNVKYFHYLNANGKYLLFEWLKRHTDQVKSIKLFTKPHEMPELWLTDLKASRSSRSWVPSPMARIVDLMQLEGMQVGEGQISLNIHDPQASWNSGVFTFGSENGKLTIEQGGSPTGKISIHALSAIIYGCADPYDFPFKGWGNLSNDSISQIMSLFPPLPAFLEELF